MLFRSGDLNLLVQYDQACASKAAPRTLRAVLFWMFETQREEKSSKTSPTEEKLIEVKVHKNMKKRFQNIRVKN